MPGARTFDFVEGWSRVRRAFGLGDDESPIAAVVSRVRSPILLPLLTGVGLLVSLHAIERMVSGPTAVRFNLEADRSFGELYGYLLAAMIIAGLAQLAGRSGQGVLWLACGFFGFVLADDVLRFHEQVGDGLPRWIGIDGFAGLEAREIGELSYFAAVGIAAIVLGMRTYRSAAPAARVTLHWLIGGVLLLGFFAAGVDAAHEILSSREGTEIGWVALEDGWEMVALALMASYVFARVEERDELTIDLRITVPAIRESVESVPAQR